MHFVVVAAEEVGGKKKKRSSKKTLQVLISQASGGDRRSLDFALSYTKTQWGKSLQKGFIRQRFEIKAFEYSRPKQSEMRLKIENETLGVIFPDCDF